MRNESNLQFSIVASFLLGLLNICVLVTLLDTHSNLQKYHESNYNDMKKLVREQEETVQKNRESANKVEHLLKLYNVPAH